MKMQRTTKIFNQPKKWISIFPFLIILTASFLSGCNEIGTATFDTVATGTITDPGSTTSPLSFAGLSSVTPVTDVTAQLNWISQAGASAYQVYNTSSGNPIYVTTIAAPANTTTLTGLAPSTTYSYRIKSLDSSGLQDSNTNDISFITNNAPDVPSGLALNDPSSSPSFIQAPTITVSGVKSGDTIKLYSDSGCSTEVGSAIASGTTVNITTSSSLVPASYTFYANATGTNTSSCSSANVSYILNACPDGYIRVPANAGLSVSTFCVMKYEAKAWNDLDSDGVLDSGEEDADGCNESGCTTANWGLATYKPGSGVYGHPWRRISQTNAWSECDSLNTESGRTNIDNDTNTDGTYALVSNPEWMTIARNVENVAANWTDGSVGSGCLLRGNVGGTNACTGGDSGYNGSDPDSGASRSDNGTASLTLDNGEEIWDFSGNVWEWVDWDSSSTLATVTPANKAYLASDGSPQSAWREFKDLDSNIAGGDEMFPDSWQATDTNLQGADGVGRYFAGTNSSGGAAFRGGNWNAGTVAGAFALILQHSSTHTLTNVGFRCVYRP